MVLSQYKTKKNLINHWCYNDDYGMDADDNFMQFHMAKAYVFEFGEQLKGY
jgi:hypothetical protein